MTRLYVPPISELRQMEKTSLRWLPSDYAFDYSRISGKRHGDGQASVCPARRPSGSTGLPVWDSVMLRHPALRIHTNSVTIPEYK
jgi:hypothetical protein